MIYLAKSLKQRRAMPSRKRKREREVESSPRLTSEDYAELVRKIADNEMTQAACKFWAKRGLTLEQANKKHASEKMRKEIKKHQNLDRRRTPVGIKSSLYAELLEIKGITGETIRHITDRAVENFISKYHA